MKCQINIIGKSHFISDLQHEFPVEPTLTSANMGENIILGCSPPEGQPRPVVRWADDDEEDDGEYNLICFNCFRWLRNGEYLDLSSDKRYQIVGKSSLG